MMELTEDDNRYILYSTLKYHVVVEQRKAGDMPESVSEEDERGEDDEGQNVKTSYGGNFGRARGRGSKSVRGSGRQSA
jgi:hypothetical protein